MASRNCPICLDRYNPIDCRPKLLKCGHSLCLQCLEGSFNMTGLAECPTCNQRFRCRMEEIPDCQGITDILVDKAKTS